MINTVTNKVVRLLGKDEPLRFLNLALYQGAPAKKGVTTLVRDWTWRWIVADLS